MNKSKGGKVAAVIDIGSSLVKMKVCQVKNKRVELIDQLECPVRIGHEVFNFGTISSDCLKESGSYPPRLPKSDGGVWRSGI